VSGVTGVPDESAILDHAQSPYQAGFAGVKAGFAGVRGGLRRGQALAGFAGVRPCVRCSNVVNGR
jgi:hypothetical protein